MLFNKVQCVHSHRLGDLWPQVIRDATDDSCSSKHDLNLSGSGESITLTTEPWYW